MISIDELIKLMGHEDNPEVRKFAEAFQLTPEQYNKHLQWTVDWVLSMLQDRDMERFIPTLIMHHLAYDQVKQEAGHTMTMAAMPDFDPNTARQMLMSLGVDTGQEGKMTQMVILITESWVLTRAKDDPTPFPKNCADDPTRGECISITCLSGDRRYAGAMIHFTRNRRNMMIAGEVEISPDGATSEMVEAGEIKARVSPNTSLDVYFAGMAMGLAERIGKRKKVISGQFRSRFGVN